MPWDDSTRRLIFATVAKGLAPADQARFEAVCESTGLDPLRNEIYAVARGGKLSIQTGIDGYLSLANRTGKLDGLEVVYYDKTGAASEVWLTKEPPAACLVRVYRRGATHPFAASCRFDAYRQPGQMWDRFPETMLAKCATTLALRRAFADEISGIASADEMEQAGMAAPELLAQGVPAEQQQQAAEPLPAPRPKAAPKAAPKPAPAKAEQAAESLAQATAGDVVEAPAEPAPSQAFPAVVEGDPGHVASLRKLAAGLGITATGWESLQVQAGPMGGIGEPSTCLKIAKALDAAKVQNLNAGRATTGGNLPAVLAA
jgi:phage recombination protein Bet